MISGCHQAGEGRRVDLSLDQNAVKRNELERKYKEMVLDIDFLASYLVYFPIVDSSPARQRISINQ